MVIVDDFLPAAAREDVHAARHGRIVVVTSWGLAAALSLGLLVRLFIDPRIVAEALVVALVSILVFWAAPWVLRSSGSVKLGGTLVVCGFFWLVATVGFFTGGLGGPVVLLAPLLPFLAVFLVDVRFGVVASGVTVVLVGAFVVLRPELPSSVLEDRELDAVRVLALAVALVLSALLAAVYERQREDAHERLRKSRELYELLFEQAKDAVAVTTPEGRLVAVNQAAALLYGYASKEALLAAGPAAGDVGREVETTVSEIRGPAGAVEHRLVIHCDVTEARQAWAQREALLVELAAKNAELERFAYTVSHDLKSPLLAIQGSLELIALDASRGDAARLAEDMDNVHRATAKMRRLIDDLLSLSRVRRSRESFTEVDLGTLVGETLELLAALLAEAHVEMTVDPGLPRVKGDPTLLGMVFQNLIENAVKFSRGRRPPRIEVGMRQSGSEDVFFVADNGIGLAPEDRDKVFHLFEKIDPGSSGTGIGLASVQLAVDVHGGRVWAESEGEGRGTTFCFTLPTVG